MVVGVMDAGTGSPGGTTAMQVASLLLRALAVIGPTHIWRALSAARVRSFVRFDPVPGAYPVSELYVDETRRNRGAPAGATECLAALD